MGKTSKLCSSVKELKKRAKEHKYEANEISETKSQPLEEPPQNVTRSSKKNKKHTHSNEPVKHKFKLEENIEVDETEPVESTPVKKRKTNKKNKTHISDETIKSVSEKNIVAVETENVGVEDAEPAELPPYTIKLKTKKRAKQDDIETNVAVVESETGDLLGDLSNNKVKTKKKNSGKLGKESKTVGTDKSIETDNQMVKPKKLKNTHLPQEDEVKDEDIDMFCEQLSEEDNVHYNNWVELIEAKLSSNKKKPK